MLNKLKQEKAVVILIIPTETIMIPRPDLSSSEAISSPPSCDRLPDLRVRPCNTSPPISPHYTFVHGSSMVLWPRADLFLSAFCAA